MPDWITHILVAWTSCKVLGFKFREFDNENTVLVMVGSLIPDIFKIYIPLDFFGVYLQYFIYPIHLPLGSLIMAALITLLFRDKKMVFVFLIFGFLTHYALDSLLTYVSGGMELLFPFSWAEWQLRIIPVDDYNLMVLVGIIALSVYAFLKLTKRCLQ